MNPEVTDSLVPLSNIASKKITRTTKKLRHIERALAKRSSESFLGIVTIVQMILKNKVSQLQDRINLKSIKTYSKQNSPEYLTSSAIITPSREVKTTLLESERCERLKLYTVKRSKVSDHDVIIDV